MSMSINKHWHVTKNAAAPLLVVISKKSGRTYFKGILKKRSPLSQRDIKNAATPIFVLICKMRPHLF